MNAALNNIQLLADADRQTMRNQRISKGVIKYHSQRRLYEQDIKDRAEVLTTRFHRDVYHRTIFPANWEGPISRSDGVHIARRIFHRYLRYNRLVEEDKEWSVLARFLDNICTTREFNDAEIDCICDGDTAIPLFPDPAPAGPSL